MSAKVQPASGSGWFAYCEECQYTSHTGPSYLVDWWADVHNHDIHLDAA